MRKERPKHNLNLYVRSPQLRLVGDNVTPGIYENRQAQQMAIDQNLDLVEISPTANPPVCKIIDYNKFLYEEKKKQKANKSHQTELKELRFTPNTDDHDLEFKIKHATKFLSEGNKVQAKVFFQGRNIVHKDRGELLLLRLADRLKDIASLEAMPKLIGKNMFVIFSPKKKNS